MNNNTRITNYDNLYGNIQVYSPDMKPMFKTNMKRIRWYLREEHEEKLADVIEWDGDSPKAIRLTFIPKGLGHFEKNRQDYFLTDKENRCVVTGTYNWRKLTKHHIVPMMYRKWFPTEYKSRNCHDIVLVTREHHYEYEILANKLKNEIAHELNLPTHSEYTRKITRKNAYIGMAKAILSKDILLENKIMLCIKFRNKTGLVPTIENVKNYIKSVDNEYKLAEFYGKIVVDKLFDYQGFVERWRKHFIDTMKPKFMSEGWEIKNDIYIINSDV